MQHSWHFIIVFVIYTARLPSVLCLTEPNVSLILPMLGPRADVDVIGLLDRSQGVGQHNFYYFVQPFFKSLLHQYAAVHPDFARSAVVTFARDATVAYDTISDRDSGVSKCELFSASPALWNRVAFNNNPNVLTGTNISGAMQHAIDILKRGRDNRPNVTQVIVIVSDGDHENHEDPINEKAILESHGVHIFTVGVGAWLRQSIMRGLATTPSYYGDRRDWQDLLDTQLTTLRPGSAPLLSELDASFCNNTCAEAGAQCYCEVDTARHKCLCPPGYHLPAKDSTASCQPCPKDSFKEIPGSGPCVECALDRVTSYNGSSSRLDCHCVNGSCSPDPCLSISCPFGKHCVALDEVNTTCESHCPFSNCSKDIVVPDEDPCIVSNPCQNNGRCYRDPGGNSACWCPFNVRGQFCDSPIDMCAEFRPCTDGASHCITLLREFKCVCKYGRHGEFCQDIDPDPPFTGVTSPTVNTTPVAMTTTGAPVQSSSVVIDFTDTISWLYTTVNSSNISLPIVELASELSGSTVAAIVVCTLIAFLILVVAIIILVVLMRKRRQRQKEEAAAKQTPVGPSTKPVQPTHNGTWSGSFHGLWKDQTWRGTPEEDELPLSDRADVVSLPPKHAKSRPKLPQNGYYQNFVTEEITLKNEQLQTSRSMEDWRRYLVQLETAGIIFGGIIVRPRSSGSGYVKTNGWTHDVAELTAIRKEMNAPRTTAKLSSAETNFLEVQGEQFAIRPGEGVASGGKATLIGICKAARTSLAAALAVDGSLVVATGSLGAGDMASARCIREVQWIADMCGPR